MHFAHLVKQASVDSVSQPICLFGAYTGAPLKSPRTVPEIIIITSACLILEIRKDIFVLIQ